MTNNSCEHTFELLDNNSLAVRNSRVVGNNSLYSFLAINQNNSVEINTSYYNNSLSSTNRLFDIKNNNSLKIDNSQFMNMNSRVAGIALIQDQNNVMFRNTSFINLGQEQANVMMNFDNRMVIMNCSFKNISNQYSGLLVANYNNSIRVNRSIVTDILTNYSSFVELQYQNQLDLNGFVFQTAQNSRTGMAKNWIDSIQQNQIELSSIVNRLNSEQELIGLGKQSKLVLANSRLDLQKQQVFVEQRDQSMLEIKDSKLIVEGGQINSESSQLIIQNSTIECRTMNGRSLITNRQSNMTIKQSNFTNQYNQRMNSQLIQQIDGIVQMDGCRFDSFNSSSDGCILQSINTNISLTNNEFMMNKGNKGGCVYVQLDSRIEHCYYVKVVQNVFVKNEGSQGGSIMVDQKDSNAKCQVEMVANTFRNNQANQGGAVYLNALNVNITDNVFDRNQARRRNNGSYGKGGALFIELKSQQVVMANNRLSNNDATIGSGLFINKDKSQFKVQYKAQNMFENSNKVDNHLKSIEFQLFGNRMLTQNNATNGVDIKMVGNSVYVGNVQSGQKYNRCLIKVMLMDSNRQQLGVKDSSISYRLVNRLTQKEQQEDRQNEIGVYIDDMDICIGNVLKRNQLPIQQTFDYELQVQQYNNVFTKHIILSFRNCWQGEKLTYNYECLECPENTYLLEKEFNKIVNSCIDCSTQHKFRCLGGLNFIPNRGYFRYNSSSTSFLECQTIDRCQYSTQTNNNCNTGYKGILCLECGQNHGQIANICLECNSRLYFISIIIGLVFKLLFVMVYVYLLLQMVFHVYYDRYDQDQKVNQYQLLRVYSNHLYMLTSIVYQVPIDYQDYQIFIIHFFTVFNSDFSSISILDCQHSLSQQFMQFIQKLVINDFIKFDYNLLKLLILCWLPLMTFVIIYLLIMVYKYLLNRQLFVQPNNHKIIDNKQLALVLMIGLIQLFQIDIIRYCFKFIIKLNVYNNQSPLYLYIFDSSLQFWSDQHQYLVYAIVVPILVFYMLIVPLTVIFCNRMYLFNNVVFIANNFSYHSYMFFYDWIQFLFQTVVIVILNVFYEQLRNQNIYPLFVLFLVLIMMLMINQLIIPFKQNRFNYLNQLWNQSLEILALTIYSSFYELIPLSQNWLLIFTFRLLALLINFYLIVQILILYFYNIYRPQNINNFNNHYVSNLFNYLSNIIKNNQYIQPIFNKPDYLEFVGQQQQNLDSQDSIDTVYTLQEQQSMEADDDQVQQIEDSIVSVDYIVQEDNHNGDYKTKNKMDHTNADWILNQRLRMQQHQQLYIKQLKMNMTAQTFKYQIDQSDDRNIFVDIFEQQHGQHSARINKENKIAQQRMEGGFGKVHLDQIIDNHCVMNPHIVQKSLIEQSSSLFVSQQLEIQQSFQIVAMDILEITIIFNSQESPFIDLEFNVVQRFQHVIVHHHLFNYSSYQKQIIIYAKILDYHINDVEAIVKFSIFKQVQQDQQFSLESSNVDDLDSIENRHENDSQNEQNSCTLQQQNGSDEQLDKQCECKLVLPIMVSNFIKYEQIPNYLAFKQKWDELDQQLMVSRIIEYDVSVYESKDIISYFQSASININNLQPLDFDGFYPKVYGKCLLRLLHDVNTYFMMLIKNNQLLFRFNFEQENNRLNRIGIQKTVNNILDCYQRIFTKQ